MSGSGTTFDRGEVERRLRALPRWAVVAFAARCARRVQPLYVAFQPPPREEHISAVERAISVAERAADAYAAHAANAYTNASAAVAIAADDAVAVAVASSAAAAATTVADADGAVARAAAAANAADAVAGVDGAIVAGFGKTVCDAVLSDLSLLEYLVGEEGWTDWTPVPPGVFGVFWPAGPPEGWPVSGVDDPLHQEIQLEVTVAEGADDEAVLAYAEALMEALSQTHVAYGGKGLKLDTVEVWESAPGRVVVGP